MHTVCSKQHSLIFLETLVVAVTFIYLLALASYTFEIESLYTAKAI